ncbi:unnamed protein product [Albugo candida]|uniref:Uncharacterized protein n=1 Tax=Albugo candida TaxID=65357 RepID=A0A024GLN3_9STRA|nr:unnamed protein product [Albugo candida]|eukprot:CCI47252.1 unnamed protein product [Albugo candida]
MAYVEQLTVLFSQDPLIDEVGYILDEASQSFQLHSHKLAIALRVAPQLFREGRDEFHSLNSNLNVPQVPDAILARLSNATRAIVLISPDFYSAWNTRRKLVGRSYLTLNEELKFCTLVLLFHPKSIDTWAYRRWLSACRPTEEHFAYLKEEIELCEIIAERYPRNYHAWSYRHWIWLQITGMNKHKSAQQTLIKEEMEMMNMWCKSHLMDGSGWNHRALLVSSALKIEWVANVMKKSAEMILSAEYEYISQLLSAYPKHEALWYHRRFVIQQYLAFAFRKETHTTSCFETLICDTSKILLESICNIRKASGASESLQLAWDSLHFHTTHNICKSTVQTVVTEIETALRFSADVTGSNLFAKQFALWLGGSFVPQNVHDLIKYQRL